MNTLKDKNLFTGMGITGLILACLVLIGCAGTYGRLSQDPDLLARYENHQLPADYTYYYIGRSTIPYAVVGIDPAWEFNKGFWSGIGTMDEVHHKIDNLSDLHPRAWDVTASHILDHQGNKIGVWYSYYRHTPVKIDAEKRMVTVYSPYNPNEDEGPAFLKQ